MTGWGLAALCLVAALIACSPAEQPMGPPVEAPRLTDHAVIAPDGYRLRLEVWPAEGTASGVPRGIVLAIHGFDDYARTFRRAAEALSARGYTVYAYDQRGFGRGANTGVWAGTDTYVADAATVGRLIAAEHPEVPLTVLGHSMGASVAMVALDRNPDWPVDRLVLVAPGIWDFDTMPAWQRWSLAAVESLLPGQVATGSAILDITPTDNAWVLREMAYDPFVLKANRVDTVAGLLRLLAAGLEAVPSIDRPVLVQYGDEEDVVPPGQIARMLETLEDAPGPVTVAFYPDGYHMLLRDLGRAVPIDDIAAWIADPGGSLPSGAPSVPRWERADQEQASVAGD